MSKARSAEQGNILLYILIAIVMIGLLTVALRDSGGLSQNVDTEKMDAEAANLIKFSAEMQNGARLLLEKGLSETSIRTAYPGGDTTDYGNITSNPQNQLFSGQGGQVNYRTFKNINNGATWHFGTDRTIPQMGSSKAELYGILTGVSKNACTAINKQVGFTSIPSINCSTASDGVLGTFSSSPTNLPTTGFTYLPAPRFCAYCSNKADYLYFTTILAR